MRTSIDKSQWNRAWITAIHEEGYQNEILIGFMPDAKMGKDRYDALKLAANQHLEFYAVQGDNKWAIQGLPQSSETTTIPLGLTIKTSGQYTININHLDQFDEMDIFLYDALTKQLTDLRTNDYQIDLVEGNYIDRFSLQFVRNRITSLEELSTTSPIYVYSYQSTLYLQSDKVSQAQSKLQVLDLSGRELFASSLKLQEGTTQLSMDKLSIGIYIVMIQTEWGRVAKQVWIGQ